VAALQQSQMAGQDAKSSVGDRRRTSWPCSKPTYVHCTWVVRVQRDRP